jgi:hypothetical protein
MQTYKILAFTIICLILSHVTAFAQWQKTNGPTGGFPGWVSASGQNAYVGIDQVVFSTTDMGAHWSPDSSAPYLSGILIDGQNYFATVGGYTNLGSIWISTDAGKSWNLQKVNPNGRQIYCLYGNSSKLFAGTDSGAYLSTDAGKSWSPRKGGITDRIYSITQLGNALYAGSWTSGLYSSTDDGANWTNVNSHIANPPYSFNPISTIVTFGNSVFAGSQDGVFRTTDNGAHWNYAHTGLGTDTACYIFSTNGSVLLMWSHIIGYLYQWSDASNSWTKVFDKGGQAAFGANAWYLTGVRGPLVSTDNGGHWTQENNGIVTFSGAIAVSGGNLYCDKTGYMFVSTDQGGSWPATYVNNPTNTGLNNDAVASMSPSTGSDLIASIDIIGSGDIVRITNQGKDRTSILGKNTLFSNGSPGGILEVGNTILTAVSRITDYVTNTSSSGIFISTDNAQTFTRHNTGLVDTLILCIATDGSNFFAGSEFGYLYKSSDNAQTWTVVSHQTYSDAIHSIAISGTTMFYTTSSGFFVSKDYGVNSVMHNEGLGAASVAGLAVDAKYVYASTSSGVMRRPLDEFLGVENAESASDMIIGCNPNPVSNSTMLKYNVSHDSHIHCSVIDVLGKVVWSSDEGVVSAGIHFSNVDANRWTTGLYRLAIFGEDKTIGSINIIRE